MRLSRIRELAQFYYLQRVKGFEVPGEPWLDPEAGTWFASELAGANLYLEFGSGGSTILAARLGVETLSIECDRFFARSVRRSLPSPNAVSVVDVDIGLTGPWGVPMPGTPNPRRLKRWRRYVDAPFSRLERMPDLILIDGRFRTACTLRSAIAARTLGQGSTVLFDDYFMDGRESYHAVERLLGSPQELGKAAIFAISPDNRVGTADVELALRDYR